MGKEDLMSGGSNSNLILKDAIGLNHNSASFWRPVLDRAGTKLVGLKAKTLSFRGRVTLLKSILASLPIPIKVKNELEKL
ncbi:Uncharacterized protein TCM_012578 [Theobroma cacao]|uniref:Uncharacterized protein n=1 Tax=Theobroma cacao TaxID=3641 RepID=A0A061FUM7_THECC|nr:Uncharacterized protein TCM_012578 [Theobroma cacao]